ncbi:MAG: TolC family protein [Bacteroidota bacterium]
MNFNQKYNFSPPSVSLLLAIILLPNILLAQNALEDLSLENFLAMAQQNAIADEAAQLDWRAAQLNFQIFRAGLKPQISATANFPNFANTFAEIQQPDGSILFPRINNNNSALGFRLDQVVPKTGGNVFVQSNLQRFDDFTNDKFSYNGTPFRVGFFQPLFAFNQWKWDKKLEPMRLREAEKKYTADKEAINLNAASLFFDLLVAHENLQIATTNKASNETLLKIAEEKFELGVISKRDLIQLQLELISSNKNKTAAEQSVRLASSAIYVFLGKIYNGEMIRPTTPEVTTLINADLTIALQEGLNNRFEQDQFVRQVVEAKMEVDRAKKDNGIQADLFASFGLTRSAGNVGDIYADPQQQQFVQLQLNVPIVDWGIRKSSINLAKAQLDFSQKNIQRNKLQLETNIKQTLDAFQNLQKQVQLDQEIKALAQERFEITKESFVLGAINITELTLAQREKDQTARTYIFTLSQYWQNYYALRNLTLYDFQERRAVVYP